MIFNLFLCVLIIVIYLITHLGNKNDKTKDSLFLILSFFVLFVVVAFREMTMGNDTLSYIKVFKECNNLKWNILNYNSYFEKGYLVFNILLSYVCSNSRFFMIIMSAIFNYSVYNFIKNNSQNYLMSILMYINLLFFYQSMTMMRQFFALSIVLLFGIKFIKEKKIIKYIITIVIASLFHSTALITIFLYPLYYAKYNKKRVFYIFLSSLLIFSFLNQIYPIISSLFKRENFYLAMMGETKLANIISMLIFCAIYLFSIIIIKRDKKEECSFYLYTTIFTAVIYFISINMAILSRASQYYAIFSIISLPNIIKVNVSERKLVYNSILIFFMILYSTIIMLYRPEWNSAYNYKSCLFVNEGYVCDY